MLFLINKTFLTRPVSKRVTTNIYLVVSENTCYDFLLKLTFVYRR